jgi:hypothetical protein
MEAPRSSRIRSTTCSLGYDLLRDLANFSHDGPEFLGEFFSIAVMFVFVNGRNPPVAKFPFQKFF